MFITEKQRKVYDQKGALYKIDILRSIRRKDAPPSIIQAIQDESHDKVLLQDPNALYKKIVEIILIAIIIVASYFLICSLINPDTSSQANIQDFTSTLQSTVPKYQFKTLPLSKIASQLHFDSKKVQDFKRQFLENAACHIVQGTIKCSMKLQISS